MQTQVTSLLQQACPNLTVNAVQDLAGLFRSKTYQKTEILLSPHSSWQQVYLIESGLLRLYFLRSDGREFNKNFYTAGQLICPLTPKMQHQASLFHIACIEPSELWVCPASQFIDVLEQYSAWETLRNHFLSQLVDSKLQREHDLLTLTAKERYAIFCQRFPKLAARIPLLHLASYLGITDVSLSRLRHNSQLLTNDKVKS